MDEPVLKLTHQHRPLEQINADLSETFTELEDVRARKKTCDAGFKEEMDAAKEALKRYSEERRKAQAVQRVIHSKPDALGE